MQVVILNRSNLAYKDYSEIGPNFDIIVDLIVSQKSSFTLLKKEVMVEIGDIVILQSKDINYIGVVSEIKKESDLSIKIYCLDFKELLNIKVPVESYSGDLCWYLKKKIEEAFINNTDEKQILRYLKVENKSVINGSIKYDDDTLINLQDLIELLSKAYGVLLKYKIGFIRGRFSSINIQIEQVSKTSKLRYDFKEIRNLQVSDTAVNSINKVIFYPKKENKSYKYQIQYFLLIDGTITNNKNDINRFDYVNSTAEFYADSDYDSLETKARSILCSASSDHEITFNIDSSNSVFIPLSNVYLGYFIEFYSEKRVYNTLLTQIKYKGNFNECYVTLGEQRTSLTDKIKLIKKNSSSSGGNVSVATKITDIDGGNFWWA